MIFLSGTQTEAYTAADPVHWRKQKPTPTNTNLDAADAAAGGVDVDLGEAVELLAPRALVDLGRRARADGRRGDVDHVGRARG